MEIETLLGELTAEEKAALVSGTDFMYTNPVPRLRIPSARMSDGPHGLRVQGGKGDNGVTASLPATAFPTAATTANGWNEDNLYNMGEAIGRECRYYGVNILLGPGVNIKRNPLCGRNFEYFSEDPLLAGKLAAAQIKGVQSTGTGACIKHYALNNAENFRFMGDSVCDTRAMREIYLKPFEIAIKEARPHALMCAYNAVNGTLLSENEFLLTRVLREEWGFCGAVMTDWGAARDRVKGLKAGLDLEMPGDTAYCRKSILEAVKDGALSAEELNGCVRNVLKLVERTRAPKTEEVNFQAHHELSGEIAADCAVLMKNDGVLPLKKGQKLLAAGELFAKMRYQGAGSSMISPVRLTSPKDAFEEHGVAFAYACGYRESETAADGALVTEAVAAGGDCDLFLAFLGLTDYVEFEGSDRESMRLPENQLALVEALIETGKKVVVVLFGGSVVELPFADRVAAILNMFLPGQNGGTAVYQLLFGEKTPCGKLAESWPLTYESVPYGKEFSKGAREVYKESVFVGYRYYQTQHVPVRFPFGFGLSYADFAYSDMRVSEEGGAFTVSCTVKNTGERDGAEIVQLYVAAPNGGVFKPEKELRAFAKLYLKAGEEGRAVMRFARDELRYFDLAQNNYVLEGGVYRFELCSDSRTVRLFQEVELEGEGLPSPYSERVQAAYCLDPASIDDGVFTEMSSLALAPVDANAPLSTESAFRDIRRSLTGRLLYRAVLSVPARQLKKARKMKEGAERDNLIKGAIFMRKILENNCLRAMSMGAGKVFPYNFAQAFAAFGNGKFFKGIALLCSKIKAPPLPKNQRC